MSPSEDVEAGRKIKRKNQSTKSSMTRRKKTREQKMRGGGEGDPRIHEELDVMKFIWIYPMKIALDAGCVNCGGIETTLRFKVLQTSSAVYALELWVCRRFIARNAASNYPKFMDVGLFSLLCVV